MSETLEAVLRLVEDGRLSPEAAAMVLTALDETPERSADAAAGSGPRSVRIEVMDGGRNVVNLRLPGSIGELALKRIPGLSEDDTARIGEALRVGLIGDLVRAIDDKGNGVRITVE